MVSRKIVFKKKQTKKNLGRKSKTSKKHHKKRRISFRVKKGGLFGNPQKAIDHLTFLVNNLEKADNKDDFQRHLNSLTTQKAGCGIGNQDCREKKAELYAKALKIVHNSDLLDENDKEKYEGIFLKKVSDKAVQAHGKTLKDQGVTVNKDGIFVEN